jgi:hypothetical protein
LQTKLAAQLASSIVHVPSQRSRHSPDTSHELDARQLSAVAVQISPWSVHRPSDSHSPAQLSAVATHLPSLALQVPSDKQLGAALQEAFVALQAPAVSKH